jgi:hypothetical protein
MENQCNSHIYDSKSGLNFLDCKANKGICIILVCKQIERNLNCFADIVDLLKLRAKILVGCAT